MINVNVLLTIVLMPLLMSAIAGLWGTKFLGPILSRKVVQSLAIFGVLVAFVLSCLVLKETVAGATLNTTLYQWMSAGSINFEVGFLVDTLTATMMCVVTFVSLMVHIYTIGYMADDDGYNRFFSYISLFTFAMLMLVMSNNLMQLFFGWEAVGLVSYLLIGFWYQKDTAIFANMKAFLVNRVGDFGFVIGIGLLVAATNSLNYTEIFAKREVLTQLQVPLFVDDVSWLSWLGGWSVVTTACICLFIGAMAKSAQFPLHVWLPDSMEGPTPISALIHAATMVTAGIFMVARMSPIFEMSDVALNFMVVTGAITALFMGFLGIVQTDIKRVVAYSTLSQLGYMTVALGVSAYSVAVFHLMTHAFFKALLFLGAGSVIIGMHHEQDMRYMGGLFKKMPITAITTLIGSLALIGTPFLSGFYSKDLIIEAAHASSLPGAKFAYYAVLAGVFVTAFYSFRMFFLVFMGKPRWDQKPHHEGDHHHDADHNEPHESPWVVTMPLILLAIPSVVIGALAVKPLIFGDYFNVGQAFQSVIFVDATKHPALTELAQHFHGALAMGLHAVQTAPFWLALAGVAASWYCYLVNPKIPAFFAKAFKPIYTLLENKYYLDDFNQKVIARGALIKGRVFWAIDRYVIDGLINGIAALLMRISRLQKRLKTGYLYNYAGSILAGVFLLLLLLGQVPLLSGLLSGQ